MLGRRLAGVESINDVEHCCGSVIPVFADDRNGFVGKTHTISPVTLALDVTAAWIETSRPNKNGSWPWLFLFWL